MESIKTNRRNTMNLIRVLLSSLRKTLYKKLGDVVNDFLNDRSDSFLFSQYFLAALDIISARLNIQVSTNTLSKPVPRYKCNITFSNKGIDFVNLPKILSNTDLRKLLPSSFNNISPMVVYDLSKTIRSSIFNYKKVVQDINVEAYIADPSLLPCSCASSPFVDRTHGHVITGDLNIVKNEKLRKLLIKGPKFREAESICWDKVKNTIHTGITESISKWETLDGIPLDTFNEWKDNVLQKVENKINILKQRIKTHHRNKILKDQVLINNLEQLQDKYVMTPIDKASNNIAFICKRYYIQVLIKELGLAGNHTDTYMSIDSDLPTIIDKHTSELHQEFKITTPDDMKTLPDIYWIPKLHKTPVKARFIIASKKCTTKQLSKDITAIFKLAYKQVETYNRKASRFSGINTFWVIQNSKPILETINHINLKNNAKCVSSYDFATLYTKIPHAKLLDELSAIIKFIFKGGSNSIISIDKSGIAHWSRKCNSSSCNYDQDSILRALKYLLDNCHFKLGNNLFQQIIGIPMGSDPAPYFANLFLYRFESKWLNKTKKENNIIARKLGKVYRFIDDLLSINDGGEFEKNFSQIYPPELELKKENTINTKTSFLELDITISDNQFYTKLYDKRDAFGFHICRLPFKCSNIPSKIFYSSASAEVLRICRASTHLLDAVASAKTLLARIIKQGAALHHLKQCIAKTLNRHADSLAKFHSTPGIILDQLFS